MPPAPSLKPEIIVVALDLDPHRGSEPGKGWWWSSALSRHYQLHVVTQVYCRDVCQREASVQEAGWKFYATEKSVTTWAFPTGYRQYAAWLRDALRICADLIRNRPIAGLCHITLGSFRMLPPYESLGIPYVLGPLGGGECAPLHHLWPRPVPLLHKLSETFRPVFNNAFAAVPHLRRTLRSAALVLATSRETEDVLRRMGARKSAVVFPDAYDQPIDMPAVLAQRRTQLEGLQKEVRLLWQGRALWWKGPDLGLLLVQRALAGGLRLRLTMVGTWNGAFGERIRRLIHRLGIAAHVDLLPSVSRNEFLRLASAHHALLATSLHDSGGIPLLEAQAFGLPCLTLGLGGNREAACPEAGVSSGKEDTAAFLRESVHCLRRWQRDPECWLREATAATLYAGLFANTRLQRTVTDLIAPSFPKRAS